MKTDASSSVMDDIARIIAPAVLRAIATREELPAIHSESGPHGLACDPSSSLTVDPARKQSESFMKEARQQ